MTKLINELAAPPNAGLTENGCELLRLWIVDGGVAEMAISPALQQPEAWGVALVDIARHVARMYADMGVCSEAAASELIWSMVEAERSRPTDLGTTERRDHH